MRKLAMIKAVYTGAGKSGFMRRSPQTLKMALKKRYGEKKN